MTPPDWRGHIAAIIASGPTAQTTDLKPLKGVAKVLAIKENIELYPDADVLYGCDGPWWDYRRGMPGFKGLKLAHDAATCTKYGIKRVEIELKTDRLLFDKPFYTGAGGNSGFHALNLVVQWGAERILLIGYDMTDRQGVHWYGRNHWPMANNPSAENWHRWIEAFTRASEQLRIRGVEVINASPMSELRCFPRRSIADALKQWQVEAVT